jgi:hypothetical protein
VGAINAVADSQDEVAYAVKVKETEEYVSDCAEAYR